METDPRTLTTSEAARPFPDRRGGTDACSNGNLTSQTASDGGVTSNTYDSLNRLTATKDPLGRITSFTYDSADNQTSVTNPAGETTTSVYDTCLLSATINPLGYRTSYTYDRFRNLSTEQNALGFITSYSYDLDGDLESVKDALGNVTTTVYDNAKQVVATIDPLGNVTSSPTTRCERAAISSEASGRPDSCTDADSPSGAGDILRNPSQQRLSDIASEQLFGGDRRRDSRFSQARRGEAVYSRDALWRIQAVSLFRAEIPIRFRTPLCGSSGRRRRGVEVVQACAGSIPNLLSQRSELRTGFRCRDQNRKTALRTEAGR